MLNVGDIVHYRSFGTPNGEYPSRCRAAIVTDVHGHLVVSLCVLNPEGMYFNQKVLKGEELIAGTWHDMEDMSHELTCF